MRPQRRCFLELSPMLRFSRIACCLLAVSWFFLAPLGPSAVAQSVASRASHPSSSQERICLSMKALAREAEKVPLDKEAASLAGIGWLEGFVIDHDNEDVVLIGRTDPNWPALHLDDLVVNLRNVWNDEPHPYCSLDPRPEDVRELNRQASQAGVISSVEQMRAFFGKLKRAWGPQSVVVGSVPRDSRHAHVMIGADYHMKKVSQGLVQLDGIRSCLDIVLGDARESVARTGQPPAVGMSMSRFWFHVGKNEPTYQESEGIVCLDKCSVVVLTERQRATADGTLFDSGEESPHANAFAQKFSQRFPKAALVVREYAQLENLYRLSALLRAMHLRDAADDAGLDLDFLLRDYRYRQETPMPPSLPGLANAKEDQGQITRGAVTYQYVAFPMACGGVSMEIDVEQRQFAQTKKNVLDRVRESVIRSRPGQAALSWRLPMRFM